MLNFLSLPKRMRINFHMLTPPSDISKPWIFAQVVRFKLFAAVASWEPNISICTPKWLILQYRIHKIPSLFNKIHKKIFELKKHWKTEQKRMKLMTKKNKIKNHYSWNARSCIVKKVAVKTPFLLISCICQAKIKSWNGLNLIPKLDKK
jgi:hypothetical protein